MIFLFNMEFLNLLKSIRKQEEGETTSAREYLMWVKIKVLHEKTLGASLISFSE